MKQEKYTYKSQIAWWFAELGRQSEVDQYLSLFPMLNSRLAKYAIGILLWNMTGKININNADDINRVQHILTSIDKLSLLDEFDNTFNELTPDEIEKIIARNEKIISISVNENFPLRYFYGESANAIKIHIWDGSRSSQTYCSWSCKAR